METLALTRNPRINSVIAVQSMLEDFNLSNKYGSAEFTAEVDFLVKGKRKVSRSVVRVLREKENYIIQLLDKTFNPKLLPVEFKTGLQTFIYFLNSYLFIAGFNPNTSIGSYTVSISPVSD